MSELHPLIWAVIFVALLVALFEVVRLGKQSGTILVNSGVSVVGVLNYLETLPLETFLGQKSMALMMLILSVINGYARWRTGDVRRPAPNLIGTGDGTRSLGTGDGRR